MLDNRRRAGKAGSAGGIGGRSRMKYECSRDALYRPHLSPPLDPGLFKGKPDALCAELARLAYFAFPPAPSAFAAALAGHGLKQALYFEDATTNTQAFAALDEGQTAYVVFRGTESSRELRICSPT